MSLGPLVTCHLRRQGWLLRRLKGSGFFKALWTFYREKEEVCREVYSAGAPLHWLTDKSRFSRWVGKGSLAATGLKGKSQMSGKLEVEGLTKNSLYNKERIILCMETGESEVPEKKKKGRRGLPYWRLEDVRSQKSRRLVWELKPACQLENEKSQNQEGLRGNCCWS